MKKVGMLVVAVALLIIFISGIQAIGNNSVGKVSATGKSVTGESVSGKATTTSFHMNITLIPLVPNITIISPENITYNFSSYAPLIIDLNTTSNFDVNRWWYNLYDLRHNITVRENQTFWPNTNFTAVRWENKMVVYANNSTGYTVNASVEFFVNVNNSVPIISIPNYIYACQNSSFSYFFNITSLDEQYLTVIFTPTSDSRRIFGNPFYIGNSSNFSYPVNYTTWAYEIISYFLNQSYLGGINNGSGMHRYNLLAYHTGGGCNPSNPICLSTKTVYITVIEVNTPPNFTTYPGVQTIYSRGENSTFYYELKADDVEDGSFTSGNLSWSINFSGEHLFNISQDGIINYTSNTTTPSVNNITLCVTDLGLQRPHENASLCNETGLNLSTCKNFSLTITNDNRPPNITSHFPIELTFTTKGTIPLMFNVTTYDPDGTIPDAYWYVDDVLQERDSGSYLDEFRYTFPCEVSGRHTVKVIVTDGLLQDSRQWNITVTEQKCVEVGGGGSTKEYCVQKWGCEDWGYCYSLRENLEKGNLSGEEYREMKENCSKLGLDDYSCGFQNRLCKDVNKCPRKQTEKIETQVCHYVKNPNCKDGVKNCHHGECELLIDCGGPCDPCPTCSDEIQNQGEEGIDCGGPCPWACEPGKPTPPHQKTRYSLLILIVILLLYILNKTYRIAEKRLKIKGVILVPVLLVALLIFSLVFLYLYSSFNVGDFVYKKNAQILGEIKNTSLTLNPMVKWQDGRYSRESIFSIGKVDDLELESIQDMLELNNQGGFSLYSWSSGGTALNEETPIKKLQDLKDYTVQIKEEDCIPSFICEEWSECRVGYNVSSMSLGKVTSGTKTRLCRDYSGCMSDFVYSESCGIRSPVSLEKTSIEEGEYLELYDVDNNIVARITKRFIEGLERLDIEIVTGE